MFALLTYNVGFINLQILKSLNLEPVNFYRTPGVWPFIFAYLKIWKGEGFGTIIYLAAIAGMGPDNIWSS